MTGKQYALIALAGGVLAAIGSLLPWATVTSGFGSISVNGMQGDGLISFIAGAIVALLGLWRFGGSAPGWTAALTLLGAVGILLVGVVDFFNVSSRLSDVESDALQATQGVGLYIVIVGGVLALIGSMTGKKEAAAAPAVDAPVPAPTAAAEALTNLEDLRTRGLITEDEYRAKKDEVLARL